MVLVAKESEQGGGGGSFVRHRFRKEPELAADDAQGQGGIAGADGVGGAEGHRRGSSGRGDPEISPVALFTERPAGKPVAP